MAILEDALKGNPMTALAVGIGTYVLAPVVLPVAVAVVRPVAKSVIKVGLVGYEWTREVIAEAREATEDMAVEARSELDRDRATDAEEGGAGRSRAATARQHRPARRSRRRS